MSSVIGLAAPADRTFWLHWIAANAVGEALGLGAVFAVGRIFFSQMGEPEGLPGRIGVAALAVVLGAFEGAVVGFAQGTVLERRLPGLSRQSWTWATTLGAMLAWALGMLPSTLFAGGADTGGEAAGPQISQALTYLLAALLGAVAGPLLAWTQVLVLRRHSPHSWIWIPANSLAWALGMPVIFLGADFAAKGGAVLIVGGMFLACLLVTGGIVGAVHGAWMIRITAIESSP